MDSESGRLGCVTPCEVELRPSDVNSGGGISVIVKKRGYADRILGLSDGAKKIEAGGTHRLLRGPVKLREGVSSLSIAP